MVKVNICRDSWEVYFIGDDQKVAEADFTTEELAYMNQVEEAWWKMQFLLGEKHRSSAKVIKDE